MTKYLSNSPFTESAGGAASESQWIEVFGKRVVLVCDDCYSTEFTQKYGKWVCKKCGSEAKKE